MQRGDYVGTQGEDVPLQDKKKGFKRNQICSHRALELLASRTVKQ